MRSIPAGESPAEASDELLPEYHFDYGKARPNRFAASCPPGGRLVVLDPDIARVFTTAEEVNTVLRALITTMPSTAAGGAGS
jgi:hypothetical protein